MKVSIIIPTLNEAPRLDKAIQTARATGAEQIIVADGGSQDESVDIASRLGCDIVHASSGRGVQQNAGARRAAGDVLLFQHADNWLEPGAVVQVKQALTDPRRLGGAFRQQIEARGIAYRAIEFGNAARVTRLGLPYGDQGLFVRRDVFFELAGFPEVKLMEDVMLMRRLRRRARPILLPGPIHVSARRWQQHGVVRQTLRNWSLLTAFAFGVHPDRLARFYRRHDARGRCSTDEGAVAGSPNA